MRSFQSWHLFAAIIAIALLLGIACLTTLRNAGPLDFVPVPEPVADDTVAPDPADDAGAEATSVPGDREAIDGRDGEGFAASTPIPAPAAAGAVSNGHRRQTGRKFPETREQREAFIEMVLVPQESAALRDAVDELRRKHQGDLDPGLSAADRQQAAAVIERLVAAEWTYRAAKHESLQDYIRTAPSLATVVRKDNHGDGGVIVHKLDADLRRHWGSGSDVAAHYWLSFDRYPKLAAAHQSLVSCRRDLARFLGKY